MGRGHPKHESVRGQESRDALVLQWIHLPRWVVNRWPHDCIRTLGTEDAEGYGMLGLIRAAELWDESRDRAFSTYAVSAIKSHILRAAQNEGYLVRMPGH